MIRSSAVVTLALVTLASAACDRTPSLSLTPELEQLTSFESGTDSWTFDREAASTGAGVVVAGEASEGASYMRLTLDAGTDFVWVERAFVLEPNTDYSVTITADTRAFEGSGDIRLAALGVNPTGSGFVSDGPAVDQWTRTLSPQPVTTDADGRAWVAVGVKGVGETGAIGIDLLGVSFLRTGES